MTRPSVRRLCAAAGVLSGAWSAVLLLADGVSFDVGVIHVSSRAPRNPALAAILLLAIAVAAAPAGSRLATLSADAGAALAILGRLFRRALSLACRLGETAERAMRPPVPAVLAALLAVLTVVVFWQRGVRVAGGSDSYGYVSEAHLFATGRMVQEQPLMRRFPYIQPPAWTPLGYTPHPDKDVLIPVYSPGLPLAMAVFERVGGPMAVYLVMPLLGALAVWCAYRLGAGLVGPGTGLGAAWLLATSPAFLFQLIFPPMSDIPAMGWWALALALVVRESPGQWAHAMAGIAAGMAILTRPNLVLLAAVIGAYLLWRTVHDRAARRERGLGLAWFCAGAAAGCLAVAWFNATWRGSPLRSGYDSSLFALSYWLKNIVNYPAWLTSSQTPLLLIGFAAPLVIGLAAGPNIAGRRTRAIVLAAFAATVFLSYVFYSPFDVWWYLRFLLPAYPPLAVLAAATLTAFATRFGALARVIAIAVAIGASLYGLSTLRGETGAGDMRYQLIAEYVRDRLPNAIVVAMQHSGSMRFYSGREILRYDQVEDLDKAIDDVQAEGYRPYLVVDEWEIDVVRKMLGGHSVRGDLDWPPIAVLPLANITVWDLAEDREAARASGRMPERLAVPDAVLRRLPP